MAKKDNDPRFDFTKVTATNIIEHLPQPGDENYGFKYTRLLSDAGDGLRFSLTVSAELLDDLRAIATGEKT